LQGGLLLGDPVFYTLTGALLEGYAEAALQPQGCLRLDLYEAGLGEQIEGMVKELYAGKGAVRATLHKYVAAR
jgi:hypothetical protein